MNTWRIWGQDQLVQELQQSFPDHIRHSYILSGPAQSGKRTLAHAFARAILCLQPPAPGMWCGTCKSCIHLDRNVHPDFSRFDLQSQTITTGSDKPASSLSIDTVRQVSKSVSLKPAASKHRVVVVDDIETMQETAQEAFLKTLEEPPPFAVLLLATTNHSALLPTILSRCVVLPMRSVSLSEIEAALMAEGVASERAQTLAQMSEGLVGWAIEAARHPSVESERAELLKIARTWIEGGSWERQVQSLSLADQFTSNRQRVFDVLHITALAWRAQLYSGAGVTDRLPLISLNTHASPDTSARCIASVVQAIFDLESNVRPRLALQNMISQWPTNS